jgi:hypothetical protein
MNLRGNGVYRANDKDIVTYEQGAVAAVFKAAYPELDAGLTGVDGEKNTDFADDASGNMNDLALEEKDLVITLAGGNADGADRAEGASNNEGQSATTTYSHGCDFLVKKGGFDKRKNARDHEMEGLAQAKQLLLGMAPESLMQTEQKFDDNKLASLDFASVRSGGFLRR